MVIQDSSSFFTVASVVERAKRQHALEYFTDVQHRPAKAYLTGPFWDLQLCSKSKTLNHRSVHINTDAETDLVYIPL